MLRQKQTFLHCRKSRFRHICLKMRAQNYPQVQIHIILHKLIHNLQPVYKIMHNMWIVRLI